MGYMDTLAAIVLIFGAAVAVLICAFVINALHTDATVTSTLGNESTAYLQTGENVMFMFDILLIFVYFGSVAASVITSFFVRSHPVFFVVGIMYMLIIVAITSVFSNAYIELGSQAGLDAIANQFQWIYFFFLHLPKIAFISMLAIAIALHGKAAETPGGY